jgi:predicted ATP-binding protein involved in virulence
MLGLNYRKTITYNFIISMKIHKLRIQNFKGFEDKEFIFDPQFNVLIGDNGTGKTSILKAIAFILEPYLYPFKDLKDKKAGFDRIYDVRTIENFSYYPVQLSAELVIADNEYSCNRKWEDATVYKFEKTVEAAKLIKNSEKLYKDIEHKKKVDLPVIALYSIGRIFGKKTTTALAPNDTTKSIFFRGYSKCLDSTRKVTETYIEWFAGYQAMLNPPIENPEFKESETLNPDLYYAVKEAIADCIENWEDVVYQFIGYKDLVGWVNENGKKYRKPFKHLSDGQKNMVGLVAELAYRCVTLNPHLGRDAVKKSQGIVLIDEIDLHLHPKWQRHIVADLKKIFPCMQFIVTTHSPFIVQSLKAEELIVLDENVEIGNDPIKRSVEEITAMEMGLEGLERSQKFQEMLETASRYFELIAEGKNSKNDKKVAELRQELNELESRYSEDAAFVALLQAERKSAKL